MEDIMIFPDIRQQVQRFREKSKRKEMEMD